LIDKILLKDSIDFNGTIPELKEKIRQNREGEFELEWIDQYDFKFLSHFSLGTLIVNGFPGATDGIKGYGNLSETGNGNTRIKLKTKLRIELYFALFVFVFIFFCGFMADENFPIWIYFLLPISLLWFWFIFRIQEKRLFEKFKNYIKRIK